MVAPKKKPKSGGFQSLGLSYPILKGVLKKGYKVPTPIQRKTMPLIMEGKDVVAMARTGSGKTAAFVIPMLEKIKRMEGKIGPKALILSPTRELSIQTFAFTKELGRFTGVKVAAILGGESMDKQFALMHDNPDVIVATPGRLLHLLVEMDQKLNMVEYLVFDEADRLFELGFQEQLNEILNRVPSQRQTLLFSATLPQILVDFAKAGLHDPELIRLDVELKLSENLRTQFIGCKAEDKPALLLHILKTIIKPEEMTVVFTATRHHVEYLRELCSKASISCTYVYSALDQEAREDNVRLFRSKQVRVLIVTDVAARGIDIPLLENVINYNFPGKPKLFVHRVGRVARAGKSGTAYSLVAFDEAPFLHELHMFLDRSLKVAKSAADDEDGIYGFAPQEVIDDEKDAINQWLLDNSDLQSLEKVCQNAYKHYLKTRSAPAGEAVKKMKDFTEAVVGVHPMFKSEGDESQAKKRSLLDQLKSYKPSATIFEIGTVRNSQPFKIMKVKRDAHDRVVEKKRKELQIKPVNISKEDFVDKDFYLSYSSQSQEAEKALGIEKSTGTQLDQAVFDLLGDEEQSLKRNKNALKWDRKKKKFVREGDNEPKKKKIKTESGAWISASYKTNIYEKWKQKNKDQAIEEENEDDEEETKDLKERNKALLTHGGKMKGGRGGKPRRGELKSKEEILKKRITEEKKRKFMNWRKSQKASRGGRPNARGGKSNSGGGRPNARGGKSNSGGGRPNARGGKANGRGGKTNSRGGRSGSRGRGRGR